MKDSYYFPHDYHARHDPKLEKLRIILGLEGVGVYWCIVEMLYENGGYLEISDIPFIAESLKTTEGLLEDMIKKQDLFEQIGDRFTSPAVLKRLNHIDVKRYKAKESINKRWNTNELPTNNEGNTIKESKVKESKVDEKTTELGGLVLKNKFLETLKGVYPMLKIESEILSCITWHKNKGRTIRSWDAAIRNWMKIAYERLGVVGGEPKSQGGSACKILN